MRPIGYIVLQYSIRLDRAARSYEHWISQAPIVYRQQILNDHSEDSKLIAEDPNCLARLKNYQSLMPMAQAVHKPMFQLKPADGAIGSHSQAAQKTYWDFKDLALKIINRAGLPEPL